MYCAQLTRYLPYGRNALQVPRSLCAICMDTTDQDARNCQHEHSRVWKLNYCNAGNRCFILCKDCPAHLPALEWFSKNHKPNLGFKNFSELKKAFGPDTYKKVKCNAVSVSLCESTLPTLPETEDKLPDSDLISDSLDTLQIWPSYSRKTSIQPYMAVNDIKIGKAAMPSELIRVTYQGQSLLVQM